MQISTVKPLVLVAALVLHIGSYAQSIVEQAARDEIVYMAKEEPAMRKAFTKAKATLDDFLKLASNPSDNTSSHALKVAISDGRNTEYFWVRSFSGSGDAFTGILNNEPRLVKKHKFGERIAFTRSQIADWTYTDNQKQQMMGNFTACALLTKQAPEQAAVFKRQYGLSCDD